MITERLRKLWKEHVVDYYRGPSECFDCHSTECNLCGVLEDTKASKNKINFYLSKSKAQLVLPLRFNVQNSFSSSRVPSEKANPERTCPETEPSQQSSQKEYQPRD